MKRVALFIAGILIALSIGIWAQQSTGINSAGGANGLTLPLSVANGGTGVTTSTGTGSTVLSNAPTLTGITGIVGQNPNFSLGGAGYIGATAIPAVSATPNTKELILCSALGAASSGTGLAGNTCGMTEVLGSQGDYLLASSWVNPVYHYKSLTDSATASGVVFSVESTNGVGLQFGTSETSATACPPGIVGGVYVPAIGTAFCSFIEVAGGNPLVVGMAGLPAGDLALLKWGADANSFWATAGGTTPVKWLQTNSTGANQATVTVGDTNASSVTNIVGGSAANTQANSVPIVTAALTAPTISSGFGTGASVTQNAGAKSFSVNVGTGGTATNGVIGLPTAAHAWACSVSEVTTPNTDATFQTATSVNSITVTNYGRTTGTVSAWTASDILQISCWPN